METNTKGQDHLGFISIPDAAAKLDMSTRTVHRLIAKGILPPKVYIGAHPRLDREKFNEVLRDFSERASAQQAAA